MHCCDVCSPAHLTWTLEFSCGLKCDSAHFGIQLQVASLHQKRVPVKVVLFIIETDQLGDFE